MKPVALILDVTAVRDFPSVAVGETITQVEENGDSFTIPLPCLIAARDRDRDSLELLVGHPAFQPVDLPYSEWRQLSAMTDVLGDDLAAAALLLATVHRCHILTGQPGRYAVLGDDPPIIELD